MLRAGRLGCERQPAKQCRPRTADHGDPSGSQAWLPTPGTGNCPRAVLHARSLPPHNQNTQESGARLRVSDLQRFDARPAGEREHRKSEALAVERLQWLVLTEGRDLVRRAERELVADHGALALFD
jgi:hypothetical protein